MIVSKTPYRLSFFGGGSDLPAFYRHSPGAVLTTAIDKYVYLSVKKKFDDLIRLSYSTTETVTNVDDIRHDLVKAALKMVSIDKSIEITSIADLPSRGTGMGSSSAYLVGLLNSLYHHLNSPVTQKDLAERACDIEINVVGKPIGKQDQYIAAYGGLNLIRFHGDETVSVEAVSCSPGTVQELQNNILLLYTNVTRSAESILKTQSQATEKSKDTRSRLQQLVDMACLFRDQLEANNLQDVGRMLHEAWMIKSSLTSDISNTFIDSCYETGRKHGAEGGKLLGAGGGGFMMFYAPPDAHKRICEALPEMRPLHVRLESKGSRIVYAE